jgi:hypothetical protein
METRIVAAQRIAVGLPVFHRIGGPVPKEEIDLLNSASETFEIVEHRTSGPGIWRDEYMTILFVTVNGQRRLYVAKVETDHPDVRVYR